jgi:pSer/pThr/pTyr-binding forkhead associated (FHA) protein
VGHLAARPRRFAPALRIAIQEDGSWAIKDLGSANGTVVNGVPIEAETPHPLQDGYVITVGETTILFRLGG